MKLNDVLSHLEALNFIDEDNKVVICVCNGKSYKKDDQLFTCDMMVSEARHFFGELEVILNQTRAYGNDIDYMYSRFCFLFKKLLPFITREIPPFAVIIIIEVCIYSQYAVWVKSSKICLSFIKPIIVFDTQKSTHSTTLLNCLNRVNLILIKCFNITRKKTICNMINMLCCVRWTFRKYKIYLFIAVEAIIIFTRNFIPSHCNTSLKFYFHVYVCGVNDAIRAVKIIKGIGFS